MKIFSKFSIKILIYSIIFLGFTNLNNLYSKWGSIRVITNHTSKDLDCRVNWGVREAGDLWNWNPPTLKQGNEIIKPGQEITILPKSSLDFTSLEIPNIDVSKGRPEENCIRLQGIGAKSEDLQLTSGKVLELNPMQGVGIAWLKDPIDSNKSVCFFAQSDDQVQIVLGDSISPYYGLKIVLGKNESKIIFPKEEIAEQEITQNNEALITFGDYVIFTNETTGNVLYFTSENKTLDAQTIKHAIDPNKPIDKLYQWEILPKPKIATETDIDINFLKDHSSCYLFSNGFLTRGDLGEAKVLGIKYPMSRFSIVKAEKTKDIFIKDNDRVKIVSYFVDEGYVVDENGIARVRWPIHNKNNVWKISLVNPRKKISAALRYPRVTREQNPKAMATGGLQGLYWLSIQDDFIFVGSGYQPGQNIFLSRKLPKELIGKLTFIGFSSNKSTANYTNILMGDPISTKESTKIYKDTKENISASGGFQWLTNYPLRSSNRGSIITKIKADKNAEIAFADPSTRDIKYVLEIGGQNNQTISISKKIGTKLEEQYKVYTPTPPIPKKESSLFQISVDDGLFLIKRDNELLFAWQDPKPFTKYNFIGFGAKKSNVEYSNIEIAPSIRLEHKRTAKEYKQIFSGFTQDYMLPFLLISPFEYWIQQYSSNIRITDPIYNPVGWNVVGMEKEGAHYFIVSISSSGEPSIKYAEDPKGSILEQAIKIGCDTLGDIGSTLTQAGGKAAAVGVLTSTVTDLTKRITKQVFKPTTGIYTEEARTATATGKPNDEVEKAKNEIADLSNKLDAIEQDAYLDPGIKFTQKIELTHRIVNNIISPENITQPMREQILRILDNLFESRTNLPQTIQPPTIYGPLTNLFISAYDNRFLLNPENPNFTGRRGDLYRKINKLSEELFNGLKNKTIEEVEIKPFHGEAIWLGELPILNQGSIFIDAAGEKDIFIIFYDETTRIRKLQEATELVQVNIGGWDNKKTAICSDGNGQAEVSVSAEKVPSAMANGITFRQYWVSYNKGVVKFGIVENNTIKELLTWKDYYPSGKVKYVGISCWDTPIRIKNVEIAPPIEQIEKQLASQKQTPQQEEVIQEQKPAVKKIAKPKEEEQTAEQAQPAPQPQQMQQAGPMPQEAISQGEPSAKELKEMQKFEKSKKSQESKKIKTTKIRDKKSEKIMREMAEIGA
ncbi:MAG: hypothetical protein WC436_02420 [Candidatus Babeliales bacterium]